MQQFAAEQFVSEHNCLLFMPGYRKRGDYGREKWSQQGDWTCNPKDAAGFQPVLYKRRNRGRNRRGDTDEWLDYGYLYFHKDQPVYQKTIESTFGVNRSTVTSIVKLMEKKGYIERENVPGDARLKKLILTPLGEEMHFKTKQTLDSLELQIRKDLTKEEIETFFNVSDKIRKNLGEKEECIHKRIKD